MPKEPKEPQHHSESRDVTVEQHDSILRLTLNRPDAGNAINYAMLETIGDALRGVNDDPEVRAVVIAAAGDDFSVGHDRSGMGEWPQALAGRAPAGSHGPAPLPEQRALTALRNVTKPTVALVRGRCIGLGLDLACVCDVRLAADTASFADDRVANAEAPATGITYTLPRLVGLSQAMRIVLLAETIAAAEAARIGLVFRVVPRAEFDEQAQRLVTTIANLPTRAYEVHKLQVLPQLDMSYEAALVHCLGVRQTHVIEDRAEGARAWLEKRPPEWTGR